MFETSDEVSWLQDLLDRSHASATEHLRGIINETRTLRASEIIGLMSGMRTLNLATVTASCEPRISAVDGHLLHAHWVFSTSRTAAKARHIAARPAVSATYLEGEDLAVFTHGHAFQIAEDDERFDETLSYLSAHYGSSPLSWGDTALYRIEPTWVVGYASQRDDLLASRGVAVAPR